MKGSKLGRAAIALAAPLALTTGLAPTASAVDPYPYGSWSVSVREHTITVKFIYYRAPEADYPHYCNAVIDEIATHPEFVGLQVAVARGDDLILERGYGIADLEWNVPVDASTIFRIGSTTKQFTAAAILKLAEQGKLGLDDPLSRYVPEFDTGGRVVTIRQMLNHTSGIPEYTTQPGFFAKMLPLNVSDAEVLSGVLLALGANIGLLLSPFARAPGRALRLLMRVSLAFGAILATISLVHIFSIHAFRPFWPPRAIDGIYIGMFIDHLIIYAIDLFAIYLYLSRLKRLHASRKPELREEPP